MKLRHLNENNMTNMVGSIGILVGYYYCDDYWYVVVLRFFENFYLSFNLCNHIVVIILYKIKFIYK